LADFIGAASAEYIGGALAAPIIGAIMPVFGMVWATLPLRISLKMGRRAAWPVGRAESGAAYL